MAEKRNTWLERFNREAGIKSAIILFGNVNDIYHNELNPGRYDNFTDVIIQSLKKKGYEKILLWDRVGGIDHHRSDQISIGDETADDDLGEEYDTGDDDEKIAPDLASPRVMRYADPVEFFPYLLEIVRDDKGKKAIILDYSDFLFGNANSLSDAERHHLVNLGKTVQSAQSYNVLARDFAMVSNIIVLVAKNTSMIPPAFYLRNPLVSLINVPLPTRMERECFLIDRQTLLRVSENLDDKRVRDDLVDNLDGFSTKEIFQIMKLSRQVEDVLTCEKLVNLYKYGEKVSPWEELSKDKLSKLEERLSARVKGQAEAIEKVRDVIIRAYTGFSGLQHSSKQKKPKGTLFFVGPTGVGKTELAKSLAEFIFGDENACIRFDMSEYNHEQSDQRLVGAPPGYVGYEAGGQLTNAVKEKPFCVILFDEIEKAHGRILDKFLQILEDGRLTDGKGETVSFSETIIIFTSNIGAAAIDPKEDCEEIRKKFIKEVENHFVKELRRPELLNRIGDNIVSFNFILDPNVFTSIAKAKFLVIKNFVEEKYNAKLMFENEEESFCFIASRVEKSNGGRGLLNTIETMIVNPLSRWIFDRMGKIEGRTIKIKLSKPDFEFEFE